PLYAGTEGTANKRRNGLNRRRTGSSSLCTPLRGSPYVRSHGANAPGLNHGFLADSEREAIQLAFRSSSVRSVCPFVCHFLCTQGRRERQTNGGTDLTDDEREALHSVLFSAAHLMSVLTGLTHPDSTTGS